MISITFYKPNGLVGRIVSFLTRSKWCHAAVVHSLYGNAVITQAHPRYGTCCWRQNRMRKADLSIDVPWIQEAWATKWLSSQWGAFYDWRDIFAIGLQLEHPKGKQGLICSELVVRFIVDAGEKHDISDDWIERVGKLRTLVPGSVSPGQLFDILQPAVKI